MILVIAARDDAPGLALAAALRAEGAAVQHVTPERLVWARGLRHELSDAGSRVALELADGTRIDSAALSGVVNRMTDLPLAHLAQASPDDRDYARNEWHAAMLGLLATLPCPLVNPPHPSSLCGAWHGPMVAAQFAATAGLSALPEIRDSGAGGSPRAASPAAGGPAHRHVAFDGRLHGPLLPARERDALLHVAHLWGARLLELRTARLPQGRCLIDATPLADPGIGGAPLRAALRKALS